MYKKFFGFKERPFQLVPNPAYLFLSKSHEEALAHLRYAVSQGDGFVEITGEVGTGKTTLCRVFLGNLGENTEAAYIFNPLMDAVQLLKAINDEFGIDSNAATQKELIDTLNAFLMEKKRRGKQVIVLIDEAQKLGLDVLEQLRLLSNLETDTSKLLQIILVGQPELREMLDSRELRQLGQRITLSCYLTPLSFRETRAYIQHRIQIASQKPGVKFTQVAFWAIYRYSGGIPRLINIASDRALLTAYGRHKRKITGAIAGSAVRELASRGDIRRHRRFHLKGLLAFFLVMAVGLSALLYAGGGFKLEFPIQPASFEAAPQPPPPAHTDQSPPAPAEASETIALSQEEPEAKSPHTAVPEPEIAPAPVFDPGSASVLDVEPSASVDASAIESPGLESPVIAPNLDDLIQELEGNRSRRSAIESVMKRWQDDVVLKEYLNDVASADDFFRLTARQNAFSILRVEAGPDLIRKLNLPAVLQLNTEDTAGPVFLPVTGYKDGGFLVKGIGTSTISVPSSELAPHWNGIAYIPWKNYYGLTGLIPRNAPEDSIVSLKMLLRDIGFRELDITPVYDSKTLRAVAYIQKKHGVMVDGLVGPLTKIILYNEIASGQIPHLAAQDATDPGEDKTP